MNVFDTHRQIVDDYAQYIRSFINISDPEIARKVEASLSEGRLWPQPLLGDTAAVTALLDRLLHHAHVLKCGPRSWRTKLQTDLQSRAGLR